MKVLMIAIAAVVAIAGCAGSQSGSSYSRGQTRGEMYVRTGVVESVRLVTIEGTNSGTGTVTGAVVGGIAGQAIEDKNTRKDGLEITVRLEGGKLTAITQEADEQFRPGDRVRILSGNGATRVTH